MMNKEFQKKEFQKIGKNHIALIVGATGFRAATPLSGSYTAQQPKP